MLPTTTQQVNPDTDSGERENGGGINNSFTAGGIWVVVFKGASRFPEVWYNRASAALIGSAK